MGSFAYQAQPFLAGRARSSEESQRCGTMGLVSQTIVIVLHSYTRMIHAASLTAPSLAHNSTSSHHETQHTNGPTSLTFALVAWDA